MHIQINLDAKVRFEQKFLNIQTKFAKKGYFWFKLQKVNISIEFNTFELVFILNFGLNKQL